ncbi:helix-turn-helix domain-containing protein [[Eubacterium] hominis]
MAVIKMTFAEKLKTLRSQKGYSQEELAQVLHVSRQAIAKWEGNNGMPDINNIIAISRLFDVSIDTLLKEESDLHTHKTLREADIIACGSFIGAAIQFVLDGGFIRGLIGGAMIPIAGFYLIKYPHHKPMAINITQLKNKLASIDRTKLCVRVIGAGIGGVIGLYLWKQGIL